MGKSDNHRQSTTHLLAQGMKNKMTAKEEEEEEGKEEQSKLLHASLLL